jgi:hypothetical protein
MRLSCIPMGRTCSSDILTMRSNLWAANQGNTSFALSCVLLYSVFCSLIRSQSSSVCVSCSLLLCPALLCSLFRFQFCSARDFSSATSLCILYFTLLPDPIVLICSFLSCSILLTVLCYLLVLLCSALLCSALLYYVLFNSRPALSSACRHFISSKLLSELLSAILSCSLLLYSFPAQLRCTVLHRTVLHCALLYCTLLLFCEILYRALLCTVLYCTVQYRATPYCSVLHCTVIYCTAL